MRGFPHAYQEVRKKVCAFINAAKVEEIIFTRGTTESINHERCVEMIKGAENPLFQKIEELFNNNSGDYRDHNDAHFRAISAIKIAISYGCDSETISSYLEKNGESALAHLFNTIGSETVEQYAKLRKMV